MTLYAADPTGQPRPIETPRSILDGAPQPVTCPRCWHRGALVLRAESPGVLPLPHSIACPLLDAEVLLAAEEAEDRIDRGTAELVITRRPTAEEITLAAAFGHEIDPDTTVTVTVTTGTRRRVFVTTAGVTVVW